MTAGGRPIRRPTTRPGIDATEARARGDRLAGIERLVVDGTNVVHALGRGHGPVPTALVLGRLRSVVPAGVAIDLVFDEPPAPGLGRRIGPGLTVHHTVDHPADDLIVALVGEAVARGTWHSSSRAAERAALASRPRVLVVTDDRELGRRVRLRGAATAPTGWLVARLARTKLAAPAAGRRRPPPSPEGLAAPSGRLESDSPSLDREPWRPGRGATKKRGNPRRRPKSTRGQG